MRKIHSISTVDRVHWVIPAYINPFMLAGMFSVLQKDTAGLLKVHISAHFRNLESGHKIPTRLNGAPTRLQIFMKPKKQSPSSLFGYRFPPHSALLFLLRPTKQSPFRKQFPFRNSQQPSPSSLIG